NRLISRSLITNGKYDSPKPDQIDTTAAIKYGVFVINIMCPHNSYDITFDPAKTHVEFHDWDGIMISLEEAVNGMLKRENLLSVNSTGGILTGDIEDGENIKNDGAKDWVCSFEIGKEIHTENIRNNLQSKKVHRMSNSALMSSTPQLLKASEPVACVTSDQVCNTLVHFSETSSEFDSTTKQLVTPFQSSEHICETLMQNVKDT
ncbi:unnamed protein product, partial [Owenia fusiformis]